MKRFLPFFSAANAAAASGRSEVVIGDVFARHTANLNGQWHVIFDPYDMGCFDYRRQPCDEAAKPSGGVFLDRQPKDRTELIEYNFDTSQTWNVPGGTGIRSEEHQEDVFKRTLPMLEKIPGFTGCTPWILCDFRSPRRPLPGILDGWNLKGVIGHDGEKKKAFAVLKKFYDEKQNKNRRCKIVFDMKTKLPFFLPACLILACGFYLSGCASPGGPPQINGYKGTPFHDSIFHGGPQKIPGRVQCAYYDLGGEGVADHDSDAINSGSGTFNKPDGTYLKQFRMNESVDISYTKFHHQTPIDDNPFELIQPPENQPYVGWTQPGEWFNMTVAVKRAGVYTIDLLYTSNRGGKISLELNGKPLVSSIDVISTKNDKETVPWRQWHHWNLMTNMAEVELPKGVSVLTLHVLTEGNINFACLDFKPKNK